MIDNNESSPLFLLSIDSVILTSSSCLRTSVSWAMSRSATLIVCDMEDRK